MKNGKRTDDKIKTTLKLPLLTPGDFISFAIDKEKSQKKSKVPWSYPEESSALDVKIRPVLNDPNWRITSVYFTDAAGKKWCRGEDADSSNREKNNIKDENNLSNFSSLNKTTYDYISCTEQSVYS